MAGVREFGRRRRTLITVIGSLATAAILAFCSPGGVTSSRPRSPMSRCGCSPLANIALPTCSVAGLSIDTGSRAKCFASYMRIHALEATDGRTSSQMGQYLTATGEETSDKTEAAKDPKTGQPTPNAARNVWVTETALGTALNTSYFA